MAKAYMKVIAVLVCNHQQGSEGFGILDLHLSRSMKHCEAADAGDERIPQHAHLQKRSDPYGCHHTSQAHVDPQTCIAYHPESTAKSP